jgi:hypothetical protein
MLKKTLFAFAAIAGIWGIAVIFSAIGENSADADPSATPIQICGKVTDDGKRDCYPLAQDSSRRLLTVPFIPDDMNPFTPLQTGCTAERHTIAAAGTYTYNGSDAHNTSLYVKNCGSNTLDVGASVASTGFPLSAGEGFVDYFGYWSGVTIPMYSASGTTVCIMECY